MRRRFAALAIFCVSSSAAGLAADRGGEDSLAVFAGIATDTAFTDSMFFPWTNDIQEIGILGFAYSHRFGTLDEITGRAIPLGEHLTLEGELGLSARFGDESLGEAWTGLYLRYDGFPWNSAVYTTLAVNTGVSVLTGKSDFERGRDENNKSTEILHYMGPELTLADPGNKDLELLLRFHHRSGVFGLFDGVVSGSTFISSGLRVRF